MRRLRLHRTELRRVHRADRTAVSLARSGTNGLQRLLREHHMIAWIDSEAARALLIIGALLALSTAKLVQVAYRRGRQNTLRKYFSATLRPDDSVRQRL
jgi:hypothetical protein